MTITLNSGCAECLVSHCSCCSAAVLQCDYQLSNLWSKLQLWPSHIHHIESGWVSNHNIIMLLYLVFSIGHTRLRCRGGHAMSAAASGAPLLSVSSQMSRHQLRVFVPSLLQQCGHRHSQILTRYSGLGCMEEHWALLIDNNSNKAEELPSPVLFSPAPVCLFVPPGPSSRASCCLCLAASGCSDFSAPPFLSVCLCFLVLRKEYKPKRVGK